MVNLQQAHHKRREKDLQLKNPGAKERRVMIKTKAKIMTKILLIKRFLIKGSIISYLL
jgi:hypothetical protein